MKVAMAVERFGFGGSGMKSMDHRDSPWWHRWRSRFLAATAFVGSLIAQGAMAAPLVSLASMSPNPAEYGQTVTFTATLVQSCGGLIAPCPTGTISIVRSPDATVCTIAITPGYIFQGSCDSSALPVGTHSVFARYNGDFNYSSAESSTKQLTIDPAISTATVTSSLNPSVYGQAVQFTVKVRTASGTPPTTGNVKFFDGGTALSGNLALSNGDAVFTTSQLSSGTTPVTHSIRAEYYGDGNYASCTGSCSDTGAVTQTVGTNSATTLTSSQNPSNFGESVRLVAKVTAVSPASGTPSGSVIFRNNGAVMGTVALDAAGMASLVKPGFSVGNHTIRATYQGAGSFSASTTTMNQVSRQICYVNGAAGGGANTGADWTNAYTDLQTALAATGCAQIWVAAGVYKPTANADRTISFIVRPAAQVFGGFAATPGSEGSFVRDPAANVTVLSGDIDGNDTGASGVDADTSQIVGSNSYHVVVMDGTTAAGKILADTMLDGLTITGGKADGATNTAGGLYCNGSGSGHECSPTLGNLAFSGNFASSAGGAMFNDGGVGGVCNPALNNVTFSGNATDTAGPGNSYGGAIFNEGGSGACAPVLTNVTFSGNQSKFGGAVYNNGNGSAPKLSLVTFSGNHATISGGAMHSYLGSSSFNKAVLWGDSAAVSGGEIYNDSASTTITNSIVQGSGGSGAGWNPVLGTDGGGNLDADPKLGVLRNNGGFTPTRRPGFGSAAIDTAGDCNDTAGGRIDADQRGVTRSRGIACDIGAVEATALEIDRIFADGFGDPLPAAGLADDYKPSNCQAVANTLNIFWERVGGGPACSAIENTDGNPAQAAATGAFSMTGQSTSNPACVNQAAYTFTLSADKQTLIGTNTASNVPMTFTRSSDGACYVGYSIFGGLNYFGTIWSFAGP